MKWMAIFAVIAIGAFVDKASAQSINTGPFTQGQADAGRQSYMTSCASCHNDDLSGKGAPAVAGKGFIASNFGKGTVGELYKFIQTSMPFCEGGSLATETYLNVVAFILEANGAKPGSQPLTPTSDVKVNDIATGEMPAGFLSGATGK